MEFTLKLSSGQKLEEFGGLRRQENVGKFGTPRDLLNGFDKNADSDMNNKVQAEVVSDGDKEVIGNWSEGHSCYALTKRLVTFCPCPRDLWNFELERDNLGYLVEKISKQHSIQEVTWLLLKAFSFIGKAECKSWENLQPGNAIEKKYYFLKKNSSWWQKFA